MATTLKKKGKLSLNGADIQKNRNTANRRLKAGKQRIHKICSEKLHKIIRFSKIFFAKKGAYTVCPGSSYPS